MLLKQARLYGKPVLPKIAGGKEWRHKKYNDDTFAQELMAVQSLIFINHFKFLIKSSISLTPTPEAPFGTYGLPFSSHAVPAISR